MNSVTASPQAAIPAEWRDFVALTKPRVMTLVVFTGLAGMLAAPVQLHPVLGFTAILCIALGAGAAAALNMWYEADLDAKMKPRHHSIGVVNLIEPPHMVAIQEKILMPVGTAITIEAAVK